MISSCAGVVLLGPVPCFVYCCVRYSSLLARCLLGISLGLATEGQLFIVSKSSEVEGAIVSPCCSMTYPYYFVRETNEAPLIPYRNQLFSPV
jgi:hypothetical protein